MDLSFLTGLFQYWIASEWYIALFMAFGVNCLVYFFVAFVISIVTSKLTYNQQVGHYILDKRINPVQVKTEMQFGVCACFVFAITSLITRFLFVNIWPDSVINVLVQILAFSLFYETYSYFIHRIMHGGLLRRAHAIHHQSIAVTPWSAYSVHPVEAFFIGVSAPIFMTMFPMSLSVILILHILGMMFTMLIHSNFVLNDSIIFSRQFNRYTIGHALHHQKGIVNFGFINSFWDRVCKTKYIPS
jgi:Delta7-sterol 5-desaturase